MVSLVNALEEPSTTRASLPGVAPAAGDPALRRYLLTVGWGVRLGISSSAFLLRLGFAECHAAGIRLLWWVCTPGSGGESGWPEPCYEVPHEEPSPVPGKQRRVPATGNPSVRRGYKRSEGCRLGDRDVRVALPSEGRIAQRTEDTLHRSQGN